MDVFNDDSFTVEKMMANVKQYDIEEIRKDVYSAMYHYNKGDYEKFGSFIGNFMKLVSGEEVDMPKANPDLDPIPDSMLPDYAEFLQGLLEETKVGSFNYTNLLTCIYEGDMAAISFYEGVKDIVIQYEKGDWFDMIGGLAAIFTGFPPLQQAM